MQKNKKYGLINCFGEIILNCNYKELILVFRNNCIVNEKNEWYCFDIQSRDKIFIHKSKDKNSTIGLEELSEIAFIIRIEDTIGILHNKHKFRRYDSISNFDTDGLAIAKRGGSWQNKNWYLPKEFNEGTTVYIEKTGIELISNSVEIKEGYFKGTKFGKWGVETKEKDPIIPFEYDSIEDFIGGRAIAKKNGKFGYIDEQGQIIIPFEYDSIENFIDGRAKAQKNGKFGYIDEQGQTLISFNYDIIAGFIKGKAKAKKNGEFALIDFNEDGIFVFKENKNFIGKYGETITEDLYGIKNTKGNTILAPKYNRIDEFKNGFAKIYGEKKYVGGGKYAPRFKFKVGYIDETGKIVAPCIFDEISEFVNGKAKAKKNDKYLIVDLFKNEKKKKNIDLSLYKINSIHSGIIINVVNFGLFIELRSGVTALLHVSELNKQNLSLANFNKCVEIEVQIMSIDENKNRISLTLPQKQTPEFK